jgi:poly(3-hydroxybutyrate) depolymerase
MIRALLIAPLLVIAWLDAPQTGALDVALTRFWEAKNPGEVARAIGDIVKSGASFDDVYGRLKEGRPYAKNAATGVILARRGEFAYTLDVPERYDPSHRYQVRFQLHGGISNSRENAEQRGRNGIGRLAGAEQIYVLPASWNEAPWWTSAQVENLRAILDTVKRTYNVDENHVVVSGVSDGGTGAYYVAMRDPTPYASFLPLNGFIGVLNNDDLHIEGDLFPGNLRNTPLFVVNGGRDPLYPIAGVEPYLEHLARGQVRITYRPRPEAGHDTSWWPSVKDDFETFVRDHAREPYPDRLTWETTDTRQSGRVHWLVIDSIGGSAGDPNLVDDLNDFTPPPRAELGFRIGSELRIDRVMPRTLADRLGLRAGDVLAAIGEVALTDTSTLIGALQSYSPHSPINVTVKRGGDMVTLTGTFDPDTVPQPRAPIFRRSGRSGRVDLVRRGNTIDVSTRGVSELTLLLSPDQFDFMQSIKVIVNGQIKHDARVEKSLTTLMKWAARDNDRTMLFGAEIRVRP